MSTEALNDQINEDATGGDDFVGDVQQGQDGKGAVTKTDETAAPAPQNNDELRAALAKLTDVTTALATPKKEEVHETPEQVAERWGIWNPEKGDPDFFKKFLRLAADMPPEEQAKAIAEYKQLFAGMQHGIVRQAVVGARNLFNEALVKQNAELKELRDYVSSQKAEQIRGRFEDFAPAFSDRETFGPILKLVATELASQTFTDEKDYFKALAEGAAALVKRVRPDFDLQTATATRSSATKNPRLPRTSVGGTGGSSGGGGGKGATVIRGENGDDAATLDWK